MKAIVKTKEEYGYVSVLDVNMPEKIGEHEVLVEISRAAICGSDIHAYEYIPSYQNFMKVPVIMGHEGSGIVKRIGEKITEFKVNDRVMGESNIYCGKCRNCRTGATHICESNLMRGLTTDGVMSEFVLFDEKNLHIIPENLSFSEAAAAQACTVSVHAMLQRLKVKAGSYVVVNGLGIIGICAAQLARLQGAVGVIIAGTDADEETRMPIAKEMGFETFNVQRSSLSEGINKIFNLNRIDYLIDASGASTAISSAAEFVRKGGEILLLGLPNKEVLFPFAQIIRSEINIITGYTSNWIDYEQTLSLLSKGSINILPLLTEYSLNEVEKAFKDAVSKKVLKPIFVFK